jgi:hypothetical protein
VLEISFFVDQLLIGLVIRDRITVRIGWQLPGTPNNLIEKRLFDVSMMFTARLKVGSRVTAYFMESDSESFSESLGTVQQINGNRKDRPANSLCVKWDGDEEEPQFYCPWELTIPEFGTRRPIASLQEALAPAVRHLASFSTEFGQFRHRDDILMKASVKPIDLRLLFDRMSREWYETVEEMVADAKLFAPIA